MNLALWECLHVAQFSSVSSAQSWECLHVAQFSSVSSAQSWECLHVAQFSSVSSAQSWECLHVAHFSSVSSAKSCECLHVAQFSSVSSAQSCIMKSLPLQTSGAISNWFYWHRIHAYEMRGSIYKQHKHVIHPVWSIEESLINIWREGVFLKLVLFLQKGCYWPSKKSCNHYLFLKCPLQIYLGVSIIIEKMWWLCQFILVSYIPYAYYTKFSEKNTFQIWAVYIIFSIQSVYIHSRYMELRKVCERSAHRKRWLMTTSLQG